MAKITGTFIDFWIGTGQYPPIMQNPDFWQIELADMQHAGISEVIIARIMENGRTHYHSNIFQEWDAGDHTARIMSAAGELGMKVWLGGHLNLAFWDRNWDFVRMMRRDLNLNVMIFRELYHQYNNHPALAGFYVSNEPDRDNMDTTDRFESLRDCLHGLYQVIHAESGLPVIVSPFFSKSLPPDELGKWWGDFLDRPLFDIIAMQDGVGCYPRRDLHPEDIPPYYAELASVYKQKNITFWNNVETFGSWPEPGDLHRISCQYEAGKPYVERSITWEYGHFLSRQQVDEKRYQAFKKWNLAE